MIDGENKPNARPFFARFEMNTKETSSVYFPIVDTHAHINLEIFDSDLNELIARSRAGRFPEIRGRQIGTDAVARPFISGLICPAVDLATSERAIALAEKYDFIFAAVGVHPNHVGLLHPGEWEGICDLVKRESGRGRLVGLGETGLDRHWDDSPFELQREYFLITLEQGRETKLPVLIHSRDANDDLDKLLHDFYSNEKPDWQVGVVHSFSGTPAQAERWLDLGFYLGFGGFVTYTNRAFSDIWEVARLIPEDKMLLETDCPFLTPHPARGKVDRNEPLLAAFVARRLAELRGATVSQIAQTTKENARRLFNLPQLLDSPSETV